MSVEPALAAYPSDQNKTVVKLTNHCFYSDAIACQKFLDILSQSDSPLKSLSWEIIPSGLDTALLVDCPLFEFDERYSQHLPSILFQFEDLGISSASLSPKVDDKKESPGMEM